MCENISTKWNKKKHRKISHFYITESDTTDRLNWSELNMSWTFTVSSSVGTCKLRKKTKKINKPLRNDSLGQIVKGHGRSSLKFSQLPLCLSTKCKTALKLPKPVTFRRTYSSLNERRVPEGAENQHKGQKFSKIWSPAPKRPRSSLPPPPSTEGRKGKWQ